MTVRSANNKDNPQQAELRDRTKRKERKRRFAVEHVYTGNEDEARPAKRQMHHSLLNEAETGRAFPDAAEDEKPMRLFGKQLVLAFGDFSMLHRWRGRARAKGKGKLRQNARRFKVVVAKECMSTMRRRK